jgi:predicted outer membrane repeat protein
VGGGAVTANESALSFISHTLFEINYAGEVGGALACLFKGIVEFSGVTLLIKNKATKEGGGALLGAVNSEFVITGSVLFKNNICTNGYGGAISLTGESRITFSNSTTFESNWAEMGGTIYLRNSEVNLKQHVTITTSHNRAKYFGGAIFHMDNIKYLQCIFFMGEFYSEDLVLISLPSYFLELDSFSPGEIYNPPLYEISSYNDSAGLENLESTYVQSTQPMQTLGMVNNPLP